ncbi:MAG: UvrD-helicase domain-containing protein [Muribaculaceae bacterium]|nr:UvrD-helicase domain-containing protein [Muribaculaceae bacterium]
MALLITLGLCIAAVAIIVIVAIRLFIMRKLKEMSLRLGGIVTYQSSHNSGNEMLRQHGECFFRDIETDLERSFDNQFITIREMKQFTNYYADLYHELKSLLKWIETFHVKPSEIIEKFVSDFENIQLFVESHNKRYIKEELDNNTDFFDHCLKYPLDKQQRRSIVSGEDNCLVISSAGSGKTSSIVGKVRYLIDVKHVEPQNILLISYTNKAAAELTIRMGVAGLRGYTFHKLAIDIIGKAKGQKPSICSDADALILKIYHELLTDKKFKRSIVEYILDYQTRKSEWERKKDERRQQLSEQKDTRLKALYPDMDGKIVYVRSEQERKICLALSLLGVKFRYEEPYEYPLADETHSQYKPDFSIYFEQDGETKRIYLEHFGVDEHSRVPLWFAEDRGITYEEANQQYNDGILWKEAAHKKFGTTLLTTSSADFNHYDIRYRLKLLLEEANVPIKEKTDEELYDMYMPPNSKQEKPFIRLVITFVTLLKSSCKSLDFVLKQTRDADDERSEFIIRNIFRPVYERYIEELKKLNQIDFTDAILQATEICRFSDNIKYDYIIVDEFQDISLDRYNFLKVLRDGTPPAKLYCVGDDWQSIYRFSGSDMSLFNQFQDYFGPTDIKKIETTYRFGEPLVSLSSHFIQQNNAQIKKDIHSFDSQVKTELQFCEYERSSYCDVIRRLVASIPLDKTIFLLGRYSFDDYYLSYKYKSIKEGNRFFYFIENRKIEFLTAHKSKGLEADYVIILQCNKDIYGFPSLVSDDAVLNYVLTKSDEYPYGEERRLFYVAITRAKIKTIVLYDKRFPSVFVDELLYSEKIE